MNKKSLMISVITIVSIICILVGSIAYYRITVNGSIKGSTGNAVFNVTGFTNESTKEIVLKEELSQEPVAEETAPAVKEATTEANETPKAE